MNGSSDFHLVSPIDFAHAYEQTSQFDKAISLYSSVMSQQIPMSAESYFDYAPLLTNAGRFNDAKSELTAAIASLPTDSIFKDVLGVICAQQQDIKGRHQTESR